MTEKQAWLKIAKAYERPRGVRTKKQNKMMLLDGVGNHYVGICYIIDHISRIDFNIRMLMSDKIHDCLEYPGEFFCSVLPKNDKLRADFCYLMYYMMVGE